MAGHVKQKKAFRIEIEESVLDDLRSRLANTRWPDQVQDAGWNYGTNKEYLKELCDHWRSQFTYSDSHFTLGKHLNFWQTISESSFQELWKNRIEMPRIRHELYIEMDSPIPGNNNLIPACPNCLMAASFSILIKPKVS